MDFGITGIHHVTSGVAGAQEDIDFFTQAVGLRMVKQTVLFDGTAPIYHLYYANANAEIGSVMTTRIGRTRKFTTPSTSAATSAVPKPWM